MISRRQTQNFKKILEYAVDQEATSRQIQVTQQPPFPLQMSKIPPAVVAEVGTFCRRLLFIGDCN